MKATLRNVLIFLGILLFFTALWFFRNIVIYILVSGVLSIIGRPLVDLFSRLRIKRWNFPRALGALLTLLIIWGVIVLFLVIFIPLITKQINFLSTIGSQDIVNIIKMPLKSIEEVLASITPGISDQLSLQDYLEKKVSEVLNIETVQNILGSLISTAGSVLVAIFSISFITFFFLKDQHLFYESILMWVPDKYVDNVTRALNSIKNLLTRYFIGIMIQSTCIMILIDIGMTIAGIEFQQALVMGLILGILNVIPYVGPWLGLFIAIIMGVASHINETWVPLVFYMIIVEAITHLIDNVVFQPVIFSNSVKAHPLEIFVVVLAAGFAAGIPGMILGIPAYTVLRVFAREFFSEFKAVQKLTSGLPEAQAIESSPVLFKKGHGNETGFTGRISQKRRPKKQSAK